MDSRQSRITTPKGLNLSIALLLSLMMLIMFAVPVAADDGCQIVLGFATLRDGINKTEGADKVGACTTQTSHNGVGNASQSTSGGAFTWRKASNWTGFTDGTKTWINGPYGLQSRLNTERFQWELTPQNPGTPSNKVDLKQEYQKTLPDAAKIDASRIYTNLTALVESNNQLTWTGDTGNKRVLVETWTSYPGYKDNIGKVTTATAEIWVTPIPELKAFFKGTTFVDPVLRSEQLEGLPPEGGKKFFVEMWVRPQDMFRPSPDPEVTDHEAELDFRNSGQLTTSGDYISWFNALRAKSYLPTGYPWTRLGYTYDWGKTSDHVGVSEFVIPKGAPIEVTSVIDTSEYLGQ